MLSSQRARVAELADRSRVRFATSVLLLSSDLRYFRTRLNISDSFKSKRRVESKRHTNSTHPGASLQSTRGIIPPPPPELGARIGRGPLRRCVVRRTLITL